MSISLRIKQIRKYLGLSQAKFAENLCLSGGYVSGLESEKRKTNDRIIRLIGITYGVNELWLKTGEGQMYDRASNARLEQVTKLFRELRPEYQEHVLLLVDNLLSLQKAEQNNVQAAD